MTESENDPIELDPTWARPIGVLAARKRALELVSAVVVIPPVAYFFLQDLGFRSATLPEWTPSLRYWMVLFGAIQVARFYLLRCPRCRAVIRTRDGVAGGLPGACRECGLLFRPPAARIAPENLSEEASARKVETQIRPAFLWAFVLIPAGVVALSAFSSGDPERWKGFTFAGLLAMTAYYLMFVKLKRAEVFSTCPRCGHHCGIAKFCRSCGAALPAKIGSGS